MRMGMSKTRIARFKLGQVLRHRVFPFRGVIFDIDPEFSNTEEWYQSIPAEVRPRKDQPFYHLFAEHAEGEYNSSVSRRAIRGRTRQASRCATRRSPKCSKRIAMAAIGRARRR